MSYVYTVAILTALNVIMACGFNLILGYGGLVSVAHPVFFAIGGYASALLAMWTGMPIPAAIACGVAIAVLASMFVSIPALRVSGDYLVIATLGFQLGLVHIINTVQFTGGANGLTNIPSLVEGPYRREWFLALVVVVAIAAVYLVHRLVHGPYGRAITAMRNDEEAFSALGRNPVRIKVAIVALGSGMAGLAGALYAHFYQFLTPEQFGIFTSAALLTMVVVGGAATTWGPIVGAVILTVLPELVRFLDLPIAVLGPLQGVIFTALVMFFIFWRPQGLMGGKRAGGGLEAWTNRNAPKPAQRPGGTQ